MTPDDARNYFFQHLPQVRNSADLLRLTFWVLPYIPEAPGRPLGRMETMKFRLQLEDSKYDEKIRVWYNSNRDVSTQIDKLAPIYNKGSNSPHFCSGLSPRMVVAGGPNFAGPGLPLGPFAREHAAAKKKLDAVQSMESWWKTFFGLTPLWLRTAYNWHKPTDEQKVILKEAKRSMVAYAKDIAKSTKAEYDHLSGQARVWVERPRSYDTDNYCKAPHWNGLVAGQQFVRINDIKENALEFHGLGAAMPGVLADIQSVCQIQCELRGWKDMGDYLVEKAMESAEERRAEMRGQMKVDVSYLEPSIPHYGPEM